MAKPPNIHGVGVKKHVKMLIYGDPGTKKTLLAGSGGKRTLIVRPPTDHTEALPVGSCDEWVVETWSDMDKVLEFARHEGAKHYDWFWVDTISQLQDYGLDDVFQFAVDRNPRRADYGPDKGEFGINMGRIGKWFRHLIMAGGFNVGVTAHPFETTNVEGDPIVMPWIQGKNMPSKICGYMNVVGYMHWQRSKVKGKDSYVELITHPRPRNPEYPESSPVIYAKDQFNALGGVMRDPTVPKIMAAIDAAKNTGTPRRPARTTSQTRRRRRAS